MSLRVNARVRVSVRVKVRVWVRASAKVVVEFLVGLFLFCMCFFFILTGILKCFSP